MTRLCLQLDAGDHLLINGADLYARERLRIELRSPARFLRGKQVIAAEQANTPAARVYLALQTAYVGPDDERDPAMEFARFLVGPFEGPDAGTMREALAAAEAGEFWRGLKLVRGKMNTQFEVVPQAGC